MAGQASFLACAYGHALWRGELKAKNSHISAVLDDDHRSKCCSVVGVLALIPLVLLELNRDLPLPACRLLLAA